MFIFAQLFCSLICCDSLVSGKEEEVMDSEKGI